MNTRLSDPQLAILRFLAEGHAPYLAFYGGDVGTEGRGSGFFWKQYDRSETPPKVDARSVRPLVTRGLLEYAGYGDYQITQLGKDLAISLQTKVDAPSKLNIHK